jgi:hypothetical protein
VIPMSHTIAVYVLMGVFGLWCAVAGALAVDGSAGPGACTTGVYLIGAVALCAYALLGTT